MSSPIKFDWSQGRAFVQEGTIFYSPNCSRTVLIPARASTLSPFETNRLEASLFKQPVWWTDVYGWQSFIPLAPSYTSSPFEPFVWMPRIVEVDVPVDPLSMSEKQERRFVMHPEDCFVWTERERLLTEAAERIRIWYKIPGNLPPPPSKFNYSQAHKSRRIAKKMISLARDWFGVWMGFVSYLIACTKKFGPSSSSSYSRPDPSSPFPVWYRRLEEVHNYPAAWLDGLMTSTICSYDATTPRAGVVFEWNKADQTRPDIEWFLAHNIPMWFVWSKEQEQAISYDRSLTFLKPPNDLIQDALSLLFHNPSSKIPLAGVIIQRYYNLGSDPITNETVKLLKFREAPSFVLEYTTHMFLSQASASARIDPEESLKPVLLAKQAEQHAAASRAAAAIPTQPMIENAEEEKGKLFNDWRDFLAIREKRQQEIIKVESSKDRQKRLSREENPRVKNADLYTWEKIRSSGGKEVYMRLRVNKKRNEQVFASYERHQRIYNSLANEWDLCREFSPEPTANSPNPDHHSTSHNPDDSDDENSDWLRDQKIKTEDDPGSFEHGTSPLPRHTPPHQQHSLVEHQSTTAPKLECMDVVEDDEDSSPLLHYSQDVVESLSYGYGYVASIPGPATQPLPEKDWETVLVALGFVAPFSNLDVEDHEKRAISNFFNNLLKKTPLPVSSDDLNSDNHAALRHLFDFGAIHRPSADLFVFSGPRSTASDWLLGVNSPVIALYICRYILSNPGAHTVVTVASRLLERGIPFRTLLGLNCSSRQMTIKEPYNPPSFRFINHVFTPQDFEAAMLRAQSVLSQPQGRAALLKGGIIWRIAKEFLSGDGVLAGPSVEVTVHRVGYMHASGTPTIHYCDDELTENEIATICGTYSLYTGTSFSLHFMLTITMLIKSFVSVFCLFSPGAN
jgi:hypothetical protein